MHSIGRHLLPAAIEKLMDSFVITVIIVATFVLPQKGASGSYTLTVNISESDFLETTIYDDLEVGSVIVVVQVTDASSIYSEFEYVFFFDDNLETGDFLKNYLSLNSKTGEVKLVQSLAKKVLKDYVFGIVAEEGTRWLQVLLWTLHVYASNKFAPEISFESVFKGSNYCHIPENNGIDAIVGYFEVTDADAGIGGEYRFAQRDSFETFNIVAENGRIALNSLVSFDYEQQNIYNITVRARDCGEYENCESLESEKTVKLVICDENDNYPLFEKDIFQLELAEEVRNIETILQVIATDQDSGLNGEIAYSIGESDASRFFTIDQKSGWIIKVKPLDAEVLPEVLKLKVTATDKGAPPKSSAALLKISLLDVNEYAPRFITSQISTQILENTRIGQEIASFRAVDDDKSNATISYSLVGLQSNFFSINRNNGTLTTLYEFDYEDKSLREVRLSVEAKEENTEIGKKTVIPFTVEILDVNDNIPVIENSDDSIDIPWNADNDFEITQIKATDADSGENGRLSFILQTEKDRFKINKATGVVSSHARSDMSKDINETFLLIIDVEDNGLNPFSTRTLLTVKFSGDLFMSNYTDGLSSEHFGMFESRPLIIAIIFVLFLSLVIVIVLIIAVKRRCNRGEFHIQHRRAFSLKELSHKNSEAVKPTEDAELQGTNFREIMQEFANRENLVPNENRIMDSAAAENVATLRKKGDVDGYVDSENEDQKEESDVSRFQQYSSIPQNSKGQALFKSDECSSKQYLVPGQPHEDDGNQQETACEDTEQQNIRDSLDNQEQIDLEWQQAIGILNGPLGLY